jgi:FkbM family methyltransferase
MVAEQQADPIPVSQASDYLWTLCAPHGPIEVVDVGANPIEGDPPYLSLLRSGRARVTGFEPQPEALAALASRKSPAETYLPHALGDGAPVTLHLYAHSGFASAFPVCRRNADLIGYARGTRLTGTLALDTVRLDDVDAVPSIDFLKIDVQGSELQIIANGAAKLGQAVMVQTEVRLLPLYDHEPSFGELAGELARQGFMFHDFAFLKRLPLRSRSQKGLRPRAHRQVLDGDAFFVRDLAQPERMSDAQLLRLALLAGEVAGSAGLAVWCLDQLSDRGAVAPDAAGRYMALLPDTLRRPDA